MSFCKHWLPCTFFLRPGTNFIYRVSTSQTASPRCLSTSYTGKHRDRVISKDELIGKVLESLAIEKNNLQVQISAAQASRGPVRSQPFRRVGTAWWPYRSGKAHCSLGVVIRPRPLRPRTAGHTSAPATLSARL